MEVEGYLAGECSLYFQEMEGYFVTEFCGGTNSFDILEDIGCRVLDYEDFGAAIGELDVPLSMSLVLILDNHMAI